MSNIQKHILFLTSWYPNPDSYSNGIFVRRHAMAVASANKVTVLFAKSISNIIEEKEIRYQENNFSEVCLFYPKLKSNIPLISGLFKLWKYKQKYKKLIDQFLAENRVDIVHVNVVFPAVFPALYVLKKTKARLFITEHWSGYYPEDGNYKGWFLTRATKKLCAQAKAIFVISEKLKHSMQSHGLKGDYHRINNVVDTVIFKPLCAEKPANDGLKIIHVSSLVEREKNILGILKIMQLLKNAKKQFSLTIVGGNADEILVYQKQVNELNLNNHIFFSGHCSSENIAQLMCKADVFLLMSHFEGMPVVVLEALSCGLPVIATDVGELKNMIPEAMGQVIPVKDNTRAFQLLLEFNRKDYLNAEKMHEYICNAFSYKAVGQSINELYAKYINDGEKNS